MFVVWKKPRGFLGLAEKAVSGTETFSRRNRLKLVHLIIFLAGILAAGSDNTVAQDGNATRDWVLDRLDAALSPPVDLSRIASMMYGLVRDQETAKLPGIRKILADVETQVRGLDPTTLECAELVNLRFIASFLELAGFGIPMEPLDTQLPDCLSLMDPFNTSSAIYSLCRFPSNTLPREILSTHMASIEALQQADGSFGSEHGLRQYYLTTHAVFALHTCDGNPDVVRRGQIFLRNGLPDMLRVGFLDGLLESMLMLKTMGVAIPNERPYSDYIRSRIRTDGSICCFDRPVCPSDEHATSLLLEFLRTAPGRTHTTD